MDSFRDLGGDRGHVQDHQELGPRSFGQKLKLPWPSKDLSKIRKSPLENSNFFVSYPNSMKFLQHLSHHILGLFS